MTYLPPVHSPLTLGQIARAAMRRVGSAERAADELARLVCGRFDAGAVTLTGSGTQALNLAIRTAARGLGVEDPVVALPAYGCYDLVSAAVGAGYRFQFYDLIPETLSPDPLSLTQAVNNGARVIVASPLYGYPVDWRVFEPLRASADHAVVEDAAQAAGSTWKDSPVGSLGDLSVLSFGRGKGWTGGGGGALLARGRYVEAAVNTAIPPPSSAESWRRAVASTAQWAFGRPFLYGLPARIPGFHLGETLYHPPEPPMRIPGYSARLALATSDASERESRLRAKRGAVISDRIGEWRPEEPRACPIQKVWGARPTYLRVAILWRGEIANRAWTKLRRLGVSPAYPRVLPELEVTRTGRSHASAFPGADAIRRDLLTLPSHRSATDRVVERIMKVLAAS